jgi:DNA-binding HxlR family transcriptional regulator
MPDHLIRTLKALADPMRVRLLGRLIEAPMSANDLAAQLGIPPTAIGRHLRRLAEAELAARPVAPGGAWAARLDRLAELGRELERLEHPGSAAGDGGPPDERDRVLRGFVADDRLVAIPSQPAKRRVVLEFLLERCFADDRPYPEKEVNQRLGLWHADVAALRRYLVDAGLMTRAGGIYRRAALRDG